MAYKDINYFLFYVLFFNLFEKFFFFFKINNEFFNFFFKFRITFFLDPLGKHSFLSSINLFLLKKLFFSFPKWERVLFIRKINRSFNKRRRFMSKINKGMYSGFSYLIENNIFFNYMEILCRYTLPFFFLNVSSFLNIDYYKINEYFFFKNQFLNNDKFTFFIPKLLFYLGNEPFFESFFFYFESSFSGLNIEFISKLNHFFFKKIFLSHLGLPIN